MRNPYKRYCATAVQNEIRMQSRFPGFRFTGWQGAARWTGKLQPLEGGTIYQVRITLGSEGSPRVFVVSPKLNPRPPHLYRNGSLCLYYPDDRSWTPDKFIADTIVPWTAEWLYFHEFWIDTGKWLGPEAPHTGPKPQPN